jgi:peptide-methionine (S)-S-oxide reductase
MRSAFLVIACTALAVPACSGSRGEDPAPAGKAAGGSSWLVERIPAPAADVPAQAGAPRTAVFAGGCFWCVEAVFEEIDGVAEVVSGYAGGPAERARYHDVTSGETGHAEVVQVTYDPARVSYGALLRVFFATHDPTQENRQGPDVGKQYRSAIFYASDEEKRVAQAYIAQLDAAKVFEARIVTTLEPLTGFYPAEADHQDYARRNPDAPYIRVHARPKVDKLRKQFPEMLEGAPAPEPAPAPTPAPEQ